MQARINDLLLAIRLDQPNVALVDLRNVRFSDVDVPVARDHDVVAVNVFGDDRRRTSRFSDVVSDDLLLACHGVKSPVRAESLSAGALSIGGKLRDLAVESDLVNPAVRPVGEEDLAFGVDRRASG